MENNIMNEVKDEMFEFWIKHSTKANEEEMLLDSKGAYISQIELPEIISLLPDLSGKDLLELAAGIGRYTSVFAGLASKVVATDFMENFVKRNKEINGFLPNVQIYQADVTVMNCEDNSFDFVFSNWLLMYLSDTDVISLFKKAMRWLRPGGYFFFRESCFYKSGDKSRDSNPTIYRSPLRYVDIIKSIHFEDNGKMYIYKIILSKSIQAYIELKANPNQVCWLLQKEELKNLMNKNNSIFSFLSEPLMSNDYGIFHFEDCAFYKDLITRLEIKTKSKVLDVGCGIGSTTFIISKIFDVNIIGWDEDVELICYAQQKLNDLQIKGVQFMSQSYDKFTISKNILFDEIICNFILSFIKFPENFIKRILEHLKSEGKLVLFDLYSTIKEHHELHDQQYFQQILQQFNAKLIEEINVNEKNIIFFKHKMETLPSTQIFNGDSMHKKLDLPSYKNLKYCCYIINK